jgi:DNA modification methylase
MAKNGTAVLKSEHSNKDSASTKEKTWPVEVWPLEKIVPYANNPRDNEAAVDKVMASLTRFGWQQPIVVNTKGIILAGHTRLAAAKRLNMVSAPVRVANNLTPDEERAYRLADNRTHEDASWVKPLLAAELRMLRAANFDLIPTGFEVDEVLAILSADAIVPEADEDVVPKAPTVPETKRGDLITLGDHRLLCGDATKAEDLDWLMLEERADLIFTDPRYNVAYEGAAGTLKGDDQKDQAFRGFLLRAFEQMFRCAKGGASIYVAHADREGLNFYRSFREAGFKLSNCLVWRKSSLILGRCDYQSQHEPVLYGWKPTASHKFYGGRKQTTVQNLGPDVTVERTAEGAWKILIEGRQFIFTGGELQVQELPTTVLYCDKPTAPEHPTMKPIALVSRFLNNSSIPGQVVLDPFGGSGSTLMACEKSGRKARLIEIEEKYCDVIVKRWETATGRKAKRK